MKNVQVITFSRIFKIKMKIRKMVNLRKELYEKNSEDKEVDRLARRIHKELLKNFRDLNVDLVLQTLDRLGNAPNLVNDDNGRWAVSSDGYQQVVTGTQRLDSTTVIIPKRAYWKTTIRAAVLYYLKQD